MLLHGYQEENKKADLRVKEAHQAMKSKDKEITELKKKVHDLEIAKML